MDSIIICSPSEKVDVSKIRSDSKNFDKLVSQNKARLVDATWTKSSSWNGFKCIELENEVSVIIH